MAILSSMVTALSSYHQDDSESDFIENKPSEPNDIEVSDKILSIKDIEDTIFDVKEIIRKTNKKTAEFLECIEIESIVLMFTFRILKYNFQENLLILEYLL